MLFPRHSWRTSGPSLALLLVGCSDNATTPVPTTVAVVAKTPSVQQPSLAAEPSPVAEPKTEPEKPFIEVSPEALAVIRKATSELPADDTWVLRLRVSWPKNVCSPQFRLVPAGNVPADDREVIESAGLRIEILKRQKEMLRGVRLNYGTMGSETGLMFDNPNFKGESLKIWEPILAADPLSSR